MNCGLVGQIYLEIKSEKLKTPIPYKLSATRNVK